MCFEELLCIYQDFLADMPLDSYGDSLGMQHVPYDYRTHPSACDRHSEPEQGTTLPFGKSHHVSLLLSMPK